MTNKVNTLKKHVPPQKRGLPWLIVIAIIFCEFLGYTWVRTESTQTILQISNAQGKMAEKISYQKALAIEKERLKSDDRITLIAKTRLNLISETSTQTIYLPESLPGGEG